MKEIGPKRKLFRAHIHYQLLKLKHLQRVICQVYFLYWSSGVRPIDRTLLFLWVAIKITQILLFHGLKYIYTVWTSESPSWIKRTKMFGGVLSFFSNANRFLGAGKSASGASRTRHAPYFHQGSLLQISLWSIQDGGLKN